MRAAPWPRSLRGKAEARDVLGREPGVGERAAAGLRDRVAQRGRPAMLDQHDRRGAARGDRLGRLPQVGGVGRFEVREVGVGDVEQAQREPVLALGDGDVAAGVLGHHDEIDDADRVVLAQPFELGGDLAFELAALEADDEHLHGSHIAPQVVESSFCLAASNSCGVSAPESSSPFRSRSRDTTSTGSGGGAAATGDRPASRTCAWCPIHRAPPNMPARTSGRGLSNMRAVIDPPRVTRHHPHRVTALSEALPLALAAAIYPPALLVLLLLTGGPRPRPLVGTYFAGAALVTAGAGLVGLALADGADVTVQRSRHASGAVYVALGLLLLPVAAWAWRRGRHPRSEREHGGQRIAEWSRRASSSRPWAFGLGLLMYLPSPLYLLAIKAIADSGDSNASQVLAVLICALSVLLFVEVPLIALYVRPAAVAGGLRRVHDWLVRNSWNLAAALALAGAVYALVKGVTQLE